MSTIQLSGNIEVDPAQIASVTLDEKGAKVNARAVTVASGDWQDLRVPEDSLLVRLHDGSEFVIRGKEEAAAAWEQLQRAKEGGKLDFPMTRNQAA